MKTLTLLIILTLPNGETYVQSETMLAAANCLDVAESVWLGSSPMVRNIDGATVPMVQAECVAGESN